ncbi:MAG: GNAT family N-acetyltransferase [Clostridiales bacterium]|nr:GNAT family N-acetyltransferase [Clostridiales bacterium]
MTVHTRTACEQDRARCQFIEAGATPSLSYIDDTWTLFNAMPGGELIISMLDQEVGGYGQFSPLFGPYGWLEALRIHPDYQGKGLGKAIYRRYLEKMAEQDITAVGMYTGVANVVSKGLAERFGLSLRGRFAEYTCPVEEPLQASADFGFLPVPQPTRPLPGSPTGNFFVLNRTFYPAEPGALEHFAARGWLFEDGAGSRLIAGARFQPHKALHVAHLEGDDEKCLRFAQALAAEIGAAGLTAVRSVEDGEQDRLFQAQDFIRGAGELITLWLGL